MELRGGSLPVSQEGRLTDPQQLRSLEFSAPTTLKRIKPPSAEVSCGNGV